MPHLFTKPWFGLERKKEKKEEVRKKKRRGEKRNVRSNKFLSFPGSAGRVGFIRKAPTYKSEFIIPRRWSWRSKRPRPLFPDSEIFSVPRTNYYVRSVVCLAHEGGSGEVARTDTPEIGNGNLNELLSIWTETPGGGEGIRSCDSSSICGALASEHAPSNSKSQRTTTQVFPASRRKGIITAAC